MLNWPTISFAEALIEKLLVNVNGGHDFITCQ